MGENQRLYINDLGDKHFHVPNLLSIQLDSYYDFMQADVDPHERSRTGLQEVFLETFPIRDFTENIILEFIEYNLGHPAAKGCPSLSAERPQTCLMEECPSCSKEYVFYHFRERTYRLRFSPEDCQKRDLTYGIPLNMRIRLINKISGEIKEQELFVVNMPLVTTRGTFIINGTERVIVSQLHRSPGVFFDHDKGKATNQTKLLYSARIIPYRGSWLDFEFDTKDLLYFRIDRKRKIVATVFLKSLGMSAKEILETFYNVEKYTKVSGGWKVAFNLADFKGKLIPFDVVSAADKKVKLAKDTKVTSLTIKKLKDEKLSEIILKDEDIIGAVIADDYQKDDMDKISVGTKITDENIAQIAKLSELNLISFSTVESNPYLYNTLVSDKTQTEEDALLDIYKILRPGDPLSVDAAREIFSGLFFKEDKYDLSVVGRVKINERLAIDVPEEIQLLTKDDVLGTVKILIDLKLNNSDSDDIDHLGNRRVRSVGELVENQFRIGLVRVQRAIQERMNSVEKIGRAHV